MLNIKEIPDHLGFYFAGFVDGEGSFHLTFRRRKDYKLPWKVSLVPQCLSERQSYPWLCLRRLLGVERFGKRGVESGCLRSITSIQSSEHVIPFFNKFGFLSAKKKRDFAIFKQMAELMSSNAHLDTEME